MEENKDIMPEQDALPEEGVDAPSAPEQEVREPSNEGEEALAEEAVSAPASDEVAETAEEIQEASEGEAASCAPWDFGEDLSQKSRAKAKGKTAFFGVFSAVLAICLALTIGLLFLGENGFHIMKTIEIFRTVYTKESAEGSGLLSAQEAADLVGKSTVTVVVYTAMESASGTQYAKASGSGFVYDDRGHICTNHHVVAGATHVQILLSDGTALNAEVVGSDADSDLAVLKADPAKLVPAKIGSSKELLVGDSVVAVGSPLGMELSGTATFGKVSFADRWLAVDDNNDGSYEKKIRVIQTDTGVNPGNSGGPMADMYGRVIGVVVRKMTGKEAIGFAIPIDGVKIVLDAIIESGSFTGENPLAEGRSLVGVTGHGGRKGMWYKSDDLTGTVSSSSVEREGYHYMPADGIWVMSVDGGNAKGALLVGDVILTVNGLAVFDTSSLIDAVNLYRVGQKVSLGILRDGTTITVELTLAEG